MGLGFWIDIGDWNWRLGLRVGIGDWGLRIWIGDWDWGFQIKDWDWGMGLRLRIGTGIWHWEL